MHHRITDKASRTHARFETSINGRRTQFTIHADLAEKIEKAIADRMAIMKIEDIARLSTLGIDHAVQEIKDADGTVHLAVKFDPSTRHIADTQINYGGASSDPIPRAEVASRSDGVDRNLWKK